MPAPKGPHPVTYSCSSRARTGTRRCGVVADYSVEELHDGVWVRVLTVCSWCAGLVFGGDEEWLSGTHTIPVRVTGPLRHVTGPVEATPRGRSGGRPRSIDDSRRKALVEAVRQGTPVPEAAHQQRISRSHAYRIVQEVNAQEAYP